MSDSPKQLDLHALKAVLEAAPLSSIDQRRLDASKVATALSH